MDCKFMNIIGTDSGCTKCIVVEADEKGNVLQNDVSGLRHGNHVEIYIIDGLKNHFGCEGFLMNAILK
jgi:hypothetical protein